MHCRKIDEYKFITFQFVFRQTHWKQQEPATTERIVTASSDDTDSSDSENANDHDLDVEYCKIHNPPKSVEINILHKLPSHSQQMARSTTKYLSAKDNTPMESEWFLHPSVDELVSQQVLLMQEEEDV